MFVQSEEQLKFISTSNNSINEQVELISEQLESSIELVEEPTIFINEKMTKNNNSRKSIEDKIQIQNSSNKNESDIKQNSLPNIKILPTWRTLQSQTNVQNIGSSSIKKSKNQNNQINYTHNQQNLEQYQNIQNIESSENQQQIDFQKEDQQFHKNEVQTNSSQKSKDTNKIYDNDFNQIQNQQNFKHYINSEDSLFKEDHFYEDFSKIQEEIYKNNSEQSKQQHSKSQIFQDDHDKNQNQIKSDNQLNNQQQKQIQEEQNKILSDSSLVQVSKTKTGRSNKLDIQDLDKQIFTQDELDYDNTLSIFTVLRKIKNNSDINNQKMQMKEYEEYLKEKIKENFQNSVQNFSEIQREKCAGQQITDSVETSNYSISGFQDVFGDLQNKQMKYVKELQELKEFKHKIQKQQTQKSQFNENQLSSQEELSIKQSENHQKQNQAQFESNSNQNQKYNISNLEQNNIKIEKNSKNLKFDIDFDKINFEDLLIKNKSQPQNFKNQTAKSIRDNKNLSEETQNKTKNYKFNCNNENNNQFNKIQMINQKYGSNYNRKQKKNDTFLLNTTEQNLQSYSTINLSSQQIQPHQFSISKNQSNFSNDYYGTNQINSQQNETNHNFTQLFSGLQNELSVNQNQNNLQSENNKSSYNQNKIQNQNYKLKNEYIKEESSEIKESQYDSKIKDSLKQSNKVIQDIQIKELTKTLEQKNDQLVKQKSEQEYQEQNFYEVLGIEKNASQQEIKKQFRKLAHLYHPDKIEEQADKEEAQQKFVQMTEAFEILKDEKERSVYDDFLKNDKKGGHQAYLEYKKKGGKGGFKQQQQQGFHGFKNFEDFFGSFFDDTNIFGQDDEMFGFGHRHFGRKGSGFESIFEGMGMGMNMNMGGSFSSSSSTTFTMGGVSKSTQKIQQADGTILIRETTIDQNGNKEVKESIQQGGQQRESIEGGFGGMEMRNNRQGRRSIFDMFDL